MEEHHWGKAQLHNSPGLFIDSSMSVLPSHSVTRSILQQLLVGLVFPNLLEAGERQILQHAASFENSSNDLLWLTCFCVFPDYTCSAEPADEDIPDAMFKESCITEQTQYFFDNEERSYSGVLDCGNCSRYGSALSACLHVCLTETGQMWLSSCSFLMTLDQTQVTLICLRPQLQRRPQKPFYLFPFPLRSAPWLHFRLSNTHIHRPPHICFVPNSFSVNLACRSRLNMAVITGRYESHLSIALLPNVNDWRHRNFHDGYKKKIPYGYECAQQYSCNALQV